MLYGNFVTHMEPINLIADYYGEKQALYFAFMIHHIAYLTIPAFIGLILQGYQIYRGIVNQDEKGFLMSFFANLDTYWNYPYLIVLAIWSTLYIESWKRKQNTIIYIWASNQRVKDIKKSQKRQQKGSTFFVERISGKKTKSVLKETPLLNASRTMVMIIFAMIAAFIIWWLCMRQLGQLLKKIEYISSDDLALFRTMFCVFIYSIAVIYFNTYFKQVAATIVTRENHKYKKDHEESMIRKNYTLGAFNSYLGMSAAAFYDKKFQNVCMLLLIVLSLKQFVMNLIDLFSP